MNRRLILFVMLFFTGLLFAQELTDIDHSLIPSESTQESDLQQDLPSGEFFLVPAPYFLWLESLPSQLDLAHELHLETMNSLLSSEQHSNEVIKLNQQQVESLNQLQQLNDQQQKQTQSLSKQVVFWRTSCITVSVVSLTGLGLYFLISKLSMN